MILVTRAQPFCYHLKSLVSFEIPNFSQQSIFFSPLLEPVYKKASYFEGIIVITSGQALFSCLHLSHNPLWCIGESVARFARRYFKKVSYAKDVQDLFTYLCALPVQTSFLYVHGDRISWPLDYYLKKKGYAVTAFQGYCLKNRSLDFKPASQEDIYVTCYSQRLMENFLKENVDWQTQAVALCLSERIAADAGNKWKNIFIKNI